MQQYLESGDPILMAEALAWSDVHPGVLAISPQADLLLQIRLAIAQHGWSPTTIQHHLRQRYGKSQQAFLNEAELQDWGSWLMIQSAEKA